jgi:cell division protein FtsI/penicillin-binding protein 2
LIDTAERIGFNRKLSADVDGTLGDLEVPYNDLEFARTAAGFRGSQLSVLGAAQLAYIVASGGRIPKIQMVEEAENHRASERVEYDGRALSATTAWRLTRMMEITVHSGTSLDAFTNRYGSSYLSDIRVAGKTGTLRVDQHSPTTSWFVGFAPSRKPRIVVAALLQNGETWRMKANEVARDLLRVYFTGHPGVTSPFDE